MINQSGKRAGRSQALRRLRRRSATGLGAVLLGLAALTFAKLGDLAQHLFATLDEKLPSAPLAIEELAAAYEQKVAVLVMAAVMIAGLVSLGVAGYHVCFGTMEQTLSVHAVLIVTPIAGLVGGASRELFSRIVLDLAAPLRMWLARLKARPVLFAAGCGAVVAILGLAVPARHGAPAMRRPACWSRDRAGRCGSGRPSSWRRSPPR